MKIHSHSATFCSASRKVSLSVALFHCAFACLLTLFSSNDLVPIYDLEDSEQNTTLLDSLASLYRSVTVIDWLVQSLATIIRAANQRMSDNGMGAILFGRQEKEFQKELASESFQHIMNQLCILHRSALWEVCRIRTEPGFDERDIARSESPNDPHLVYRIRIVCQEGAICRNGIDIDGCDNIGNVEMGEVIEAYDRCINSSGVLRYKTSRGWVSELTRGHGRENIAEVIDVRKGSGPPVTFHATKDQRDLKRVECGVPDLCSVSASVLARLHGSHTELFSSFERIISSRLRNARDAFPSAAFPPYISSISTILSKNLRQDFKFADGKSEATTCSDDLPNLSHDAARCMYLGNILNLFHNCLYSERRLDRRGSLNIPLLLSLLTSEGWKAGIYPPGDSSDEEKTESGPQTYVFISAIQFVLKHSLRDMAILAVKKKALREEQLSKPSDSQKHKSSHQRVSKAVASSFPPTISLLQRLISRQTLIDSPICLSLTKMKSAHLKALISDDATKLSGCNPSFNPNQFARGLHLQLAKVSFEVFSDDRLCCAPAHVLHPWIQYMKNMITNLEQAAIQRNIISPSLSNSATSRARGSAGGQSRLVNDLIGSLSVQQLEAFGGMNEIESVRIPTRLMRPPSEPFEPSEESIARLMEMGFARDHGKRLCRICFLQPIAISLTLIYSHQLLSRSRLWEAIG